MRRLLFGLLIATGLGLAMATTSMAKDDAPAKSAVYTTVNGAPVAVPAVASDARGTVQEVGWRARAYRRGYVAPYVAPYAVYRPYVRPYVYGGYAPYSYGGYGYAPYGYGTYYRGAYPAYGYGYAW
jgi:hypothetical protein